MSTSITLSLDTRRARKDDTYPIIIRIGHNQRTTSIKTGHRLKETDWDKSRRKIKKSHRGTRPVARLNNELLALVSKASEAINELRETNRLSRLSIKEIKNKILHALWPSEVSPVLPNSQPGLVEFSNVLRNEFIEARRVGNARTYKFATSAFMGLVGKTEIEFHEVTYKLLMDVEKRHLARGNSLNSLSVYFRTIRAIYNEAVRRGYAVKDDSPFSTYRIKSKPTRKRAISSGDLKKLFEVDCSDSDKLELAQDMFLSSFHLMGMNFKDLAQLKIKHIEGGRLNYVRAKTGHRFDVMINPQLESVIAKYLAGKDKSAYLFPIVKRLKVEEIEKDIEWARKRFNRNLKEIAKRAGVETNLTSYVARHSFASLAKNKEIPLAAISEMLGHKSIKTTQVYLDSLSSEARDKYHATILDLDKYRQYHIAVDVINLSLVKNMQSTGFLI